MRTISVVCAERQNAPNIPDQFIPNDQKPCATIALSAAELSFELYQSEYLFEIEAIPVASSYGIS